MLNANHLIFNTLYLQISLCAAVEMTIVLSLGLRSKDSYLGRKF